MKHQRPQAILFDLDDTILEFDIAADRVWEAVCDEFAPRLDGSEPAQLMDAIVAFQTWYWGDRSRHREGRLDLDAAWHRIAVGAFRQLGTTDEQLSREFASTYSRKRWEAIRPLPGAMETLRVLRSSGVRMGLVTNGNASLQRSKVERFGLAAYFDCILIEGELDYGKPDVRIFRDALAQLEVEPANAWMVGDSLEFDVAGSQHSGLAGVWVDSRDEGLPESADVCPDRIVAAISELV